MSFTFEILQSYTERNIKRVMGELDPQLATTVMKDDIPGYNSTKLGECKSAEMVTLYCDIRGSTARSYRIGPFNTVLSMQALLPTLARIVVERGGFVVDFPGDGILGQWEVKEDCGVVIRNAVTAAAWMMEATANIVNPLLRSRSIEPLTIAIGIDFGEVLITKLGIPNYICTKAIGDSINFASYLSSREINPGQILMSLRAKHRGYTDLDHSLLVPQRPAIIYDQINPSAVRVTPQEQLLLPRAPGYFDAILELLK